MFAGVMIKPVKTKIMREIFRGKQQAETNAAQYIKADTLGCFHRTEKFCFAEKIKTEPCEKDKECIFFSDPVDSHGIQSGSPESCGQQSYFAVEQFQCEKIKHDSCQRAKQDIREASDCFVGNTKGWVIGTNCTVPFFCN